MNKTLQKNKRIFIFLLLMSFIFSISLVSALVGVDVNPPRTQTIINQFTGNLTNFTEMQDTPAAFNGSDCVLVRDDGTGLIFGTCPAGAETDPQFVLNWTAYNTTWSTDTDTHIYNTSSEIYAVVANGTFTTNTSVGVYNDSMKAYVDAQAGSDATWIQNWSYYNTTWSSIINTSYYLTTNPFGFYNITNFDISDYFTSAQVLGFSYYNATTFDIDDYLTEANTTYAGNFSATDDFCIAGGTCLSGVDGTNWNANYSDFLVSYNYATNSTFYILADWVANYSANNPAWLNVTNMSYDLAWKYTINDSFYLDSNPDSFITNATMNKTVDCNDIVGSPDNDFCTDVSGSSFVNTTGNYLYNDSSVTIILNETRLNASLDSYNTSLQVYSDAQDTSYNTSLKNYCDAQDVNYNTTMTTYVDAKDTVFNDSIKSYVDDVAADTSKNTSGNYLYNDTNTIFLNETRLNASLDSYNTSMQVYVVGVNGTMQTYVVGVNATMKAYVDDVALDTDTHANTTGIYLYNNSITIILNETRLNETIGAYNDSMQVYVVGVNATMKSYVDDVASDTDTHANTTGIYLYNNSITIILNETRLNETIGAYNTSQTAYTDAQDTTFNTSLKNYADDTFNTNATMNKSVDCNDIIGSPDADFCTDADSGAANVFDQWLNTTSNVTHYNISLYGELEVSQNITGQWIINTIFDWVLGDATTRNYLDWNGTTLTFSETFLNTTIGIFNDSMQTYVVAVNATMKSYVDDAGGGPETDPFWQGNATDWNATWIATTNSSYDIAWKYTTNNTFTNNASVGIYNDTQTVYTDAQDTTFNTSIQNYCDAQDVNYNTTMTTYVDALDVSYNTTMTTYVDDKDTSFNTSLKNYADDTFVDESGDTITGNITIGNIYFTNQSDDNAAYFYHNGTGWVFVG